MKAFTLHKQEDNLNDFIFESTITDKNVCNYLIDQYHMMEHHQGRVSRDDTENFVKGLELTVEWYRAKEQDDLRSK